MLDRRAAGEDGAARALRSVGVDRGAQAEPGRLAAGGVELLLAHRRPAADADRGRGEDLDQVSAAVGELGDEAADLLRLAGGLRDALDRGQDPRPGQGAAGEPVAQRQVAGRSHALHRGDAAEEGAVGVLQAQEGGELGRLVAVLPVGSAVGIEVPVDVDVGVDQTRQKGHAGEVVDPVGGR